MKNWEKELNSIARQCIVEDNLNFEYLYVTLSNQAADWIVANNYGIKDGDTFSLPLDDGSALKFTFYSKTTKLEFTNIHTGKTQLLISDEIDGDVEYQALHSWQDTMEVTGIKLGYAPNEKWAEFLNTLNVGDTVTFEGAHTYCCLKKQGGLFTFLETFTGNPQDITADTFTHCKICNLNIYSDSERRWFCSKNKYDVMGIVIPKVTESTFAQQYINKTMSELQKGQTKNMSWGPIQMSVRKNRIKKDLIWYMNGQQIPETLAKMILGYFNNTPTSTDFVRDSCDNLTAFNDFECLNKIKELCSTIKFNDVYDLITNYVLNNQQSLSINLKTFAPDDKGNYISTCFAFKYENKQVRVYQINYEDNDFSKNINSINDSNEHDFVDFCHKINERNQAFWLKDSFKQYKLTHPTEIQQRVMDKTIQLKTQNNPIINETNINTYIPLDSLIAGYDNVSKEETQNANSSIFRLFDEER